MDTPNPSLWVPIPTMYGVSFPFFLPFPLTLTPSQEKPRCINNPPYPKIREKQGFILDLVPQTPSVTVTMISNVYPKMESVHTIMLD